MKEKYITLLIFYLGSALNETSSSYQANKNQIQKKLMQYCPLEFADSWSNSSPPGNRKDALNSTNELDYW